MPTLRVRCVRECERERVGEENGGKGVKRCEWRWEVWRGRAGGEGRVRVVCFGLVWFGVWCVVCGDSARFQRSLQPHPVDLV